MRIDKLTTKFQEALADAQTLALGGDQSNIEPLHLLVALLRQDDGPRSLLQRAGANVGQLQAAAEKADRKSTRLNSNHLVISYAVFCLKKKKNRRAMHTPQHHTNIYTYYHASTT